MAKAFFNASRHAYSVTLTKHHEIEPENIAQDNPLARHHLLHNPWALFDNGNLLTQGDIASGDIYDRNSPFAFSNGSGGALMLQNIPISIGEVFELGLFVGE